MILDIFGTRIEVDLNSVDTARKEQIRQEWSQCLAPPQPGQANSVIVRIPVTDEGPRTNYTLHRQVTQALIHQHAGKLVLFHAGAIADEGGQVIGFVAPSGTGKTTFARQMGTRWKYVTDETLAVKPDGTVLAYPKPLSIGSHSGSSQKVGLAPTQAGLQPLKSPKAPLRLSGLIILDRFDWYEEAPKLTELAPLEASAQLMSQTSSMLLHPHPLHTLTRISSLGVGTWKLRYRDAADCPTLIDTLFTEATNRTLKSAICAGESPTRPWTCLGPGTIKASSLPNPAATGTSTQTSPTDPAKSLHEMREAERSCVKIIRGPWVDALAGEDGEVLVALPDMAYLLSALSGSVWRLCAQPRNLRELLAAITAQYGPVPQADQILLSRVSELLSAKILQLKAN